MLTTLEPREVVHAVGWGTALKGVSDGVWRMSETGEVRIRVSGPRRYTFVKDLQVLNSSGFMTDCRLRVLREGSIISLFGWGLILLPRMMESGLYVPRLVKLIVAAQYEEREKFLLLEG